MGKPLTAQALRIRQLVSRLAENAVAAGTVPGIGIIVSQGGEHFSTFAGKADLQTDVPFSNETGLEVSCLMKLFMALVTLNLARHGSLDLKRPVGEYLPEMALAAPEKASSITIEHILSHTAGDKYLDVDQAANRWGSSWSRLVEFVARSPQIFPPGAIFSYGHSWHVVLGEILKRTTQKSPLELVEENIFLQLDIKPGTVQTDRRIPNRLLTGYNTTAEGLATKTMPPPGRFWEASLPDSTLRLGEIVAIGEAIINAEHGPHGAFHPKLRPALQQRFTSTRELYYHKIAERSPHAFGLGCGHFRYGLIGCNGSADGRTTALRLHLKNNYVIAIAMNTWRPVFRDFMIEEIARFLERDASGVESEAGMLKAHDILGGYTPKELCGVYVTNSGSDVEVRADSGALHLHRAGRDTVSIQGLGAGRSDVPIHISPATPLAFFRHETLKEPLLAIGGAAYYRAGTAT